MDVSYIYHVLMHLEVVSLLLEKNESIQVLA